jgi:hypothetical protein
MKMLMKVVMEKMVSEVINSRLNRFRKIVSRYYLVT